MISRGWYTVKPGKCSDVYQATLNPNTVWYVYADDSQGGYWQGNYQLCTYENGFKAYKANQTCPGGTWRGFKKVYSQKGETHI